MFMVQQDIKLAIQQKNGPSKIFKSTDLFFHTIRLVIFLKNDLVHLWTFISRWNHD